MQQVLDQRTVRDEAENGILRRGLFWRGDVLWINKKVGGRRHQVSAGCKSVEEGLEVFHEFLREHGFKPRAGAGRRTVQERTALTKGLYWRGGVIWLSRVVNGQHYNISTGTANPKLAEQFLADFNLKVFKGEKLGVAARTKTTFADLAGRYLEQGRLGGLRPKTLARYTAVRDHFEKFLSQRRLAGADAAAITPTVIEDYKAWRASTPLNRNGWPILQTSHS